MGGMSTLESHPWWSKSTAADNFQELGPPGRYHYEMYHINVDSWFICVYSGFFFSLLYLGASGTTSFATFISSILWAPLIGFFADGLENFFIDMLAEEYIPKGVPQPTGQVNGLSSFLCFIGALCTLTKFVSGVFNLCVGSAGAVAAFCS